MTLEDRIRWSNIYLIVFTEENKEKNKEEGVFIESGPRLQWGEWGALSIKFILDPRSQGQSSIYTNSRMSASLNLVS